MARNHLAGELAWRHFPLFILNIAASLTAVIFAATAHESGDSMMIMLFRDAVTVAVEGSHEQMVPVGPPAQFAKVFSHKKAEVLVCKPCAGARGITKEALTAGCKFGDMGDSHAHVSREGCKAVSF